MQIKRKTNTGGAKKCLLFSHNSKCRVDVYFAGNLNKNRKTAEKRKRGKHSDDGEGSSGSAGYTSSAGYIYSDDPPEGSDSLSPRQRRSRKRDNTRSAVEEAHQDTDKDLFTEEEAAAALSACAGGRGGGLTGSLAGAKGSAAGPSSGSSKCPRPQLVSVKNAAKYNNDPQLLPVTPMTPFYALE